MAEDTQAEIVVSHEPERSRYELRLDGELVGVADYRRDGDEVAFTHTGTEPAFRGRGLAAELVEFALGDARREGLRVRPLCSYVADYIDAHPEYRDLLAD